MERLSSGVTGLDEVLGGGLPAGAINLILGLPGSGKTLLAQQLTFHHATAESPALYLSTVSEPFDKIVRYGQQLSFFDADAVGKRVFYEDLGSSLMDDGLRQISERVSRMLDSYQPGLLVIDSFKPLSAFAESESEYRRFLHALAARLSVRPMTSVWVGEYSTSDLINAPEFAAADAVIWVASTRHEEREMRQLQVLKLRGSNHPSGKHSYRLSSEGVTVFPRLADPGSPSMYELEERRVSTGIQTLDPLVGGGYRAGSATLVLGPSGIGKTVMGLQFVCASGEDQPALVATLEENPSQLARTAASFGWSLKRARVELMYRPAVDLYLDEWVYERLDAVESTNAERVFIDGVANLRAAAPDALRFKEYLYSFVQRCSRRGTTLMMSLETPELFGVARLTDMSISQIADNILLLQFLRHDLDYRRAMTFMKTRASAIPARAWEYTISAKGITLSQDQRPRRRAA